MEYFDSHAHYDDDRFAEEFPGGAHNALLLAREAGVRRITNIGTNLTTSRNSIALAEQYAFITAAVGLHPCDAQEIPAGEVDAALYEIERLAAHEKVRAIGEIGYDYHYDDTDKERQSYVLEAQLCMAESLGLPVVIHARDAAGDTFDTIRRHPKSRGVLHSYSGTAEMARQLADLGWYISFSGPVTYKNASKVKEAAAIVPEDKLLIETDCPYLPPVPYRGKINYSGYLPYTCAGVALARGTSPEHIAQITYQNACRFFAVHD